MSNMQTPRPLGFFVAHQPCHQTIVAVMVPTPKHCDLLARFVLHLPRAKERSVRESAYQNGTEAPADLRNHVDGIGCVQCSRPAEAADNESIGLAFLEMLACSTQYITNSRARPERGETSAPLQILPAVS